LLKKKLNKIEGLNASKLNQFINSLAKKLDPLTLIPHGSLVKGEFVDRLSDIDIIVISSKLENIELKRTLYFGFKRSPKHLLKVDATAYTL